MDGNNRRDGITAERVDLFTEMFVNRPEPPVPIQKTDGSYGFLRTPLTTDLVRKHLEGSLTLGLLLSEDGRTKFGVIDIDQASPDAVAPVWEQCDAIGLPDITVFSGRKGFHVIVFFDMPTPAAEVKATIQLVAGKHEVWPRQTRLGDGAIGNLIKAPFSIHRVTGKWCLPVNRQFETIDDYWDLLRGVQRVNADKLLAEAYLRAQSGCRGSAVGGALVPHEMKPCLQEQLNQGTDLGSRNAVGFALATEMRRCGLEDNDALIALEQWNTRNRPPFPSREVEVLCRSAYGRSQPYEYGCNPDGALRRIVACPGRSACPYYEKMRRQWNGRRNVSCKSLPQETEPQRLGGQPS